MKNFKLGVGLVLATIIFIPQIAIAAWWNPFTWAIFNKAETKTQILENRIVELENKLKSVATTTVSTSTNVVILKVTPVLQNIKKQSVFEAKTNTTNIPAEYLRPDGSFYTTQEIVNNRTDKECKSKYGVNSLWDGKFCACENGYEANDSGTSCQIKQANSNNYDTCNVELEPGFAYSPDQLESIYCAKCGILCPVINVRILNR